MFVLPSGQAEQVPVEVTHKVLFDINSGSQRLGTVTIGLFGKQVPRLASYNF